MPINRTKTPSPTAAASSHADAENLTDDLPVLDDSVLKGFLREQPSGFLTEFVPHFQEMTRYRLTAALRAAEDGNWTAVASSIQEMGAEARSMGLKRWESECDKVVTMCAEKQTGAAGSLISELQQHCLEGVDALRAYIHAHDPQK